MLGQHCGWHWMNVSYPIILPISTSVGEWTQRARFSFRRGSFYWELFVSKMARQVWNRSEQLGTTATFCCMNNSVLGDIHTWDSYSKATNTLTSVLSLNVVLWVPIMLRKCPAVTHVVAESECSVQVPEPKLRDFCTKLLVQPEEIVWVLIQTHSCFLTYCKDTIGGN